MHPKFIIVTQPGEDRGLLRMGEVYNHRDLIIDYEKVHGGGWWHKDDEKMQITLYGSSGDYGKADLKFLDMIPREFRAYTFWYTPVLSIPANPLDLSNIDWV